MATCNCCGETCYLTKIDNGIGPYEFWGAKGNDSQIEIVSCCCEADYILDPNETEEDHFDHFDEPYDDF